MSTGADSEAYRRAKWAKALVAILVVGVLCFVGMFVLQASSFLGVFGFVVEKLDGLGLNPLLARVIACVVWLPFLFFLGLSLSWWSSRKTYTGLVGLSVLAAGYFLAGYYLTRAQNFTTRTNEGGETVIVATRWFARTPEGYRFYERPGVDPVYGIALKPLTPEVAAAARGGLERRALSSLDAVPELFDSATGEALVWYSGNPDGDIRFFLSSGFDANTGEPRRLITPELVARHTGRQARDRTEQAATEQAHASAAAEEARRVAVEKARAEETAFRNHLVDSSVVARLARGGSCLAVSIAKDGQPADDAASRLSELLRKEGLCTLTGLLRAPAFDPALFTSLTRGDATLIQRLGLGLMDGALILGRLRASPAPQTGLGTVSVTANLELFLVPLPGGSNEVLRVSAAGAGFDEEKAWTAGVERAIESAARQGLVGRARASLSS